MSIRGAPAAFAALLCLGFLASGWGAPAALAADGDGGGARAQQDSAPKDEDAGGAMKMEAVEIHGELEHPDVFYIIPRRKADFDMGTLSKDYSEQIMTPILPGPFEAVHGASGR